MRLNLTDVYKILADVTERNNDKLKTFAALKFTEEFNDVAFNKSKLYLEEDNEGIFYSKAYADDNYPANRTRIDFPALIAFQNSSSVAHNFNLVYNIDLYTVNLAESKQKVWEVLMTELDAYLVLILRELQKYVYITSDEQTGWFSSDVVDANETAGLYTNLERKSWLRERLKSRQITIERGYAETPKNLITVGTTIQIVSCI